MDLVNPASVSRIHWQKFTLISRNRQPQDSLYLSFIGTAAAICWFMFHRSPFLQTVAFLRHACTLVSRASEVESCSSVLIWIHDARLWTLRASPACCIQLKSFALVATASLMQNTTLTAVQFHRRLMLCMPAASFPVSTIMPSYHTHLPLQIQWNSLNCLPRSGGGGQTCALPSISALKRLLHGSIRHPPSDRFGLVITALAAWLVVISNTGGARSKKIRRLKDTQCCVAV